MSHSRAYLQQLPEMKRQQQKEEEYKQQLNRLFQMISDPVTAAAELGETKYLYDIRPWLKEQQLQQHMRFQQQHQKELAQLNMLGRTTEVSKKQQLFNAQMQAYTQAQRSCSGVFIPQTEAPEGPSEELLAGLREKFYGCMVSLQEEWIETRQGVKELKKGILVDWS